jgi:hypothetical protein
VFFPRPYALMHAAIFDAVNSFDRAAELGAAAKRA